MDNQSVPEWVPGEALAYSQNVEAWRVDLLERCTAHTINRCPECHPDQKPEYLVYYAESLTELIENKGLRLFWQWLKQASDARGRDLDHVVFFLDEVINAAYRADQTETNQGSTRAKSKSRNAAIGKAQDVLTEVLLSLDTLQDAATREDINTAIESLTRSAELSSGYELTSERAGCPWIRFATETHVSACNYFKDTPPAQERVRELGTVFSGRQLNRQAIAKRIRNLSRCNDAV